MIDGEVLFLAEHLEDVARGDAAEFVEAFLGKLEAVLFDDAAPGNPMERHGVGQGAVAIEDDSFNHENQS